MNNKAFTLIELLVVVLIIGILSAIALPQYRKAVFKARATEMLIIGRSIQKAEQIYKLANGNYTGNLEELDVQMPCSYSAYAGSDTSVKSNISCPNIYGYVYEGFVSLYLKTVSGFRINFEYNPAGISACVEPDGFSMSGLCATLGATYSETKESGEKVYIF